MPGNIPFFEVFSLAMAAAVFGFALFNRRLLPKGLANPFVLALLCLGGEILASTLKAPEFRELFQLLEQTLLALTSLFLFLGSLQMTQGRKEKAPHFPEEEGT